MEMNSGWILSKYTFDGKTHFFDAESDVECSAFFSLDILFWSRKSHSQTVAVSICEKSGKYADIISANPVATKFSNFGHIEIGNKIAKK